MPNLKISELDEKVSIVANDYLPIVDSEAGPIQTKKVKFDVIYDLFALVGHNHAGVYEPVIAAGVATQYWRGDKAWATLNQAAVAGLTTGDSPIFANLTLNPGYLGISIPATGNIFAASVLSGFAYFDVYGYQSSRGLLIRGLCQKGTQASPSATLAGNVPLDLWAYGWGTTWGLGARISFVADENWTATAHGMRIDFATTPIGSITTAQVMRLAPNGAITTTKAVTHQIGNLQISDDGTYCSLARVA